MNRACKARGVGRTARRRFASPLKIRGFARAAVRRRLVRDELCFGRTRRETLATFRHALRLGECPRMLVTTTPRPISALNAITHGAGYGGDAFDDVAERSQRLTRIYRCAEGAMDRYGATSPKVAGRADPGMSMARWLWRRDELEALRRRRRAVRSGCRHQSIHRFRQGRMRMLRDCRGGGAVKDLGAGGRVGGRQCAGRFAIGLGLAAPRRAEGVSGPCVSRRWEPKAVTWCATCCAPQAPGFMCGWCGRAKVKRARAEPITALYARGAAREARGGVPTLEDEMCAFGVDGLRRVPDRVDALVWALTDLMLGGFGPRCERFSGRTNARLVTTSPRAARRKLLAWHAPGQPVWSARDPAVFAREGYARNAIAYRCVRMIAEAAASAPLKVGPVDHPLARLLARPNPEQTGVELLEAYGHPRVSGNAFLEAASFDDSVPAELYVLRPDRMSVVPGGDGWPIGWEHRVGANVRRLRRDPTATTRRSCI